MDFSVDNNNHQGHYFPPDHHVETSESWQVTLDEYGNEIALESDSEDVKVKPELETDEEQEDETQDVTYNPYIPDPLEDLPSEDTNNPPCYAVKTYGRSRKQNLPSVTIPSNSSSASSAQNPLFNNKTTEGEKTGGGQKRPNILSQVSLPLKVPRIDSSTIKPAQTFKVNVISLTPQAQTIQSNNPRQYRSRKQSLPTSKINASTSSTSTSIATSQSIPAARNSVAPKKTYATRNRNSVNPKKITRNDENTPSSENQGPVKIVYRYENGKVVPILPPGSIPLSSSSSSLPSKAGQQATAKNSEKVATPQPLPPPTIPSEPLQPTNRNLELFNNVSKFKDYIHCYKCFTTFYKLQDLSLHFDKCNPTPHPPSWSFQDHKLAQAKLLPKVQKKQQQQQQKSTGKEKPVKNAPVSSPSVPSLPILSPSPPPPEVIAQEIEVEFVQEVKIVEEFEIAEQVEIAEEVEVDPIDELFLGEDEFFLPLPTTSKSKRSTGSKQTINLEPEEDEEEDSIFNLKPRRNKKKKKQPISDIQISDCDSIIRSRSSSPLNVDPISPDIQISDCDSVARSRSPSPSPPNREPDPPERVFKRKKRIGKGQKCGDRVFPSVSAGQEHMKEVHGATEGVKEREKDTETTRLCPECGKILKASYFDLHMRRHNREGYFKCTFEGCDRQFITSYLLRYHERRHNPELRIPCPVDGCSESFITNFDLRDHQNEVHLKVTPFECRFADCGKVFSSIRERKNHVEMFHREKKFKCTFGNCGKGFKNRYYLNLHSVTHIQKSERQIFCDFPGCRTQLTSMGGWYIHKRTCHGKSASQTAPSHTPTQSESDKDKVRTRDFLCPTCGKAFYTDQSLRSHTNSHKRPFLCSFCGKGFPVDRLLQTHLLLHTGELPFKCRFCDKAFRSTLAVKTHEGRMHAGFRPYKCKFCDEKFLASKVLRNHVVRQHPDCEFDPQNPSTYRIHLWSEYNKLLEAKLAS